MSGPTGSEQWMYSSGAASFYSHIISQSLRFNNDDTPRLSRTWGAAATDDTTWTVSMWVKRASQDGGGWHTLFAEESEAWTVCAFYNDTIYIQINAGGAAHYIQTNRLFRDFSAWYHIVVAFDEDNSTAAHRLRLYINGVEETSFAADQRSSISSSSNSNWNTNGKSCAIGARSATNNSLNFDGYIAEFHNVDGQQLTPSSFGETKDGVWIPKAYSGSHGTNGFYLPFDDSSAIGDDESANTNDWTVAGLTATDVVLDSPSGNNWCTLNPLSKGSGTITFSEGNLKSSTAGSTAAAEHGATFTIPKSGKWYWEAAYTGALTNGAQAAMMGIMDIDTQTVGVSGNHLTNTTGDYITYYTHNSGIYENNTLDSSFSGNEAAATVGFALDMDNGYLFIHLNGTYIGGTPNFSTGANHAAEPNTTRTWLPFFTANGGGTVTWRANFGQDSEGISSAQSPDNGIGTFEYDVPADYKALCTSNLPNITIGPGQDTQADDHFNTVLYTGTGSNISVSGVGFSPNWVWLKSRSLAYDNMIFDTVRGTNKILKSNGAAVEITSVSTTLLSFDSDGFTYGTEASVNTASSTNVGWNWKGGGSANTFNVDGTGYGSASDAGLSGGNITPTGASVNTTAGFSIIGYTGNGSVGQTIKHGLSSAPEFIIIKDRVANSSNNQWQISSTAQGDDYGYFTSDAFAGVAQMVPTGGDATTNTIGIDGTVLTNESGDTFIMYSFHSVEGYSKFGKFSGTGADDGPFVWTGFRPSIVMTKRSDSSADWHIMDDKRNPINVMDGLLFPNLTTIETSDAAYNRDFLSNGFKIRGSEPYVNASGGTFIYMAFAHSPFKFANAF